MFMFSFSLDVLVFSVLALIMIISFNLYEEGREKLFSDLNIFLASTIRGSMICRSAT